MDEEYTDRMYELIEDGTNFLYKKIKEENLIEKPVAIVKSNRNENEYIVHEDIGIISLIRQKGRKYFRIAKDENSINITPRRRKDILYINQEDLKKLHDAVPILKKYAETGATAPGAIDFKAKIAVKNLLKFLPFS